MGKKSSRRTSTAGSDLTTNQGIPISNNQDSLRNGPRGPAFLEDFILREKITHFDHERIPERVVHARGTGAHGYFELSRPLPEYTSASIFNAPKTRTPVFARFSTVAGGAGSTDTPRDVRGFAVKFYTNEGNWDLVGNNIPVFFIQDAIKFPDLIHALKMEPDRGFPQAASAHDTFWDFISLMPESMHAVLWAMSDRTLPRSLRMMDGFGVHSYRFINAAGDSTFVKFHWRTNQGLQSTLWDEAVRISGADPDFHRRDLFESIQAGRFPEWTLLVQIFSEEEAAQLPFDHLDPTKLIPEELIPLVPVGRMVLDRYPDNFFAETEQVAFCPGNIIPGIDFSNDPLLQGRLFSYLDTQLLRLGTPNFHQLPINAPRCDASNFQRDGRMQFQIPRGRVSYEPNSLDPNGPEESAFGFRSFPEVAEAMTKGRIRPESFSDHYSQARQFFLSQSEVEQSHIRSAFVFELSKVETPEIRERFLENLQHVDEQLANSVAEETRTPIRKSTVTKGMGEASNQCPLPQYASLQLIGNMRADLAGRTVGILIAEGTDAQQLANLCNSLSEAGADAVLVSESIGDIPLNDGSTAAVFKQLAGNPSVFFDAIAVILTPAAAANHLRNCHATAFVRDAFEHLKAIALDRGGRMLFEGTILNHDEAVVNVAETEKFLIFAAKRLWSRERVIFPARSPVSKDDDQ